MNAAAVGAGALTALTATAAYGLAQQHEANEAACIARHAPPPPPPQRHWLVRQPAPPPSARRAAQWVRVYWPTTATRPGTLYGWIVDDKGPEVVVVVAGTTTEPSPALAYAAQVLGTATLEDSPPARSGAVLHACVHTDSPAVRILNEAWTACPFSIVSYTPPDVQRGQWLCTRETRAPRDMPWTRMEHLLAMDPARRDEFLAPRAPGAPFRDALLRMNMARYASTPPPRLRWRATQHTLVRWRAQLPPIPERVRRVAAVSALWRALTQRATQLGAWPDLWAAQHAVHEALCREQPPPVRPLHRALRACWAGTLVCMLDMALGVLVARAMSHAMPTLTTAMAEGLVWIDGAAFTRLFDWLAHWPLGIKLNDELALFLSDVLGWIAQTYSHCVLVPVRPYIPCIMAGLAVGTRWLGVTCLFGAMADLLMLATVHMRLMYLGLRGVYAFFGRAASELFDVFRSRKRNPLHGGRLDKAEHDVDQLFLGTILFTLLVFLFPTVYMYYLACAAPFLLVQGACACLDAARELVAAEPLALALRHRWDAAPAGRHGVV
ncbi:pig-Q [Malassezia caprae]|uniref:Pig-Q n=1 Tax=Malassezia caprae TaxID=1381934 RepID=A0AAF0E917_9BASI|nr:pig-Q [Malassezia caprae]